MQLSQREGPQVEEEISSGQRVPAFPVEVQSAASRDQEFISGAVPVVGALEEIFPVVVFMNFIEDYDRLGRVPTDPDEQISCIRFLLNRFR